MHVLSLSVFAFNVHALTFYLGVLSIDGVKVKLEILISALVASIGLLAFLVLLNFFMTL